MGHHGLAGIALLGVFMVSPVLRAEEERALTGVVRGPEDKPVAGIEVHLEIGRARYALTEDFVVWGSVRTDHVSSGADGTFKFADLPEGASLVLWAKSADGFASATGAANATLQLAPLGRVSGKLVGKPAQLKGARVGVSGAFGPWTQGKVDEESGRFEVGGLVPGEATLHVQRGNFEVARAPVQVTSGEETKVKPVRIPDGFLPVADPLVDVLRVRLVDPRGRPVKGVQFVWSSQWGDGGMSSDDEGIVRLAGGGVAIGGPPYLLRLSYLQQDTNRLRGVVKGEKGGTVTVEVNALAEVSGTVTLARKRLDLYRLYAVVGDKRPQVLAAKVEKGRYSLHLPEGSHRIVVGAVDGTLHETTLQVGAAGPQTQDLVLP
jgi:hypothetical protein